MVKKRNQYGYLFILFTLNPKGGEQNERKGEERSDEVQGADAGSGEAQRTGQGESEHICSRCYGSSQHQQRKKCIGGGEK